MAESSEFYQSAGLCVEVYDALTQATFQGDVDFYVRAARACDGPVLELGAGTGRVTWPIGQAGGEIVGLDNSPWMIEVARAKAERHALVVQRRVEFVRGDMRSFDLGREFALVIIPFRAFQGLITPAAQRESLRCIWRHLGEGGLLIIDLFDPRLDWCVPAAAPRPFRHELRHPASGRRVVVDVVSRENDALRQILREDWRFLEYGDDGKVVRREYQVLTLRWTYRWEMRYLLELCGFVVEKECSDFEGGAPVYGREQVWYVRKR